MRNTQFQELFLKTIRELAREELSPERAKALLETYDARWQPLMTDHYKRFGDSSKSWARDMEGIRNYFDMRRDIIIGYVETGIAQLQAAQEVKPGTAHST